MTITKLWPGKILDDKADRLWSALGEAGLLR
jgi:hypothetical protein